GRGRLAQVPVWVPEWAAIVGAPALEQVGVEDRAGRAAADRAGLGCVVAAEVDDRRRGGRAGGRVAVAELAPAVEAPALDRVVVEQRARAAAAPRRHHPLDRAAQAQADGGPRR